METLLPNWSLLVGGVGLMLCLEGILWAGFPSLARKLAAWLSAGSAATVRRLGLGFLALGLAVYFLAAMEIAAVALEGGTPGPFWRMARALALALGLEGLLCLAKPVLMHAMAREVAELAEHSRDEMQILGVLALVLGVFLAWLAS